MLVKYWSVPWCFVSSSRFCFYWLHNSVIMKIIGTYFSVLPSIQRPVIVCQYSFIPSKNLYFLWSLTVYRNLVSFLFNILLWRIKSYSVSFQMHQRAVPQQRAGFGRNEWRGAAGALQGGSFPRAAVRAGNNCDRCLPKSQHHPRRTQRVSRISIRNTLNHGALRHTSTRRHHIVACWYPVNIRNFHHFFYSSSALKL